MMRTKHLIAAVVCGLLAMPDTSDAARKKKDTPKGMMMYNL